jgi:hypothetical protein
MDKADLRARDDRSGGVLPDRNGEADFMSRASSVGRRALLLAAVWAFASAGRICAGRGHRGRQASAERQGPHARRQRGRPVAVHRQDGDRHGILGDLVPQTALSSSPRSKRSRR